MANKLAPVAPAPSADERRYRAEDALRTIARAHEHLKDKGLMRDVRKLAQHQAKATGALKAKKAR